MSGPAPPPNGLIDPSWGFIVPPLGSTTHPQFWAPNTIIRPPPAKAYRGNRYPINPPGGSSSHGSPVTTSTGITSRTSSQPGKDRSVIYSSKAELDRFVSDHIWIVLTTGIYLCPIMASTTPYSLLDLVHSSRHSLSTS